MNADKIGNAAHSVLQWKGRLKEFDACLAGKPGDVVVGGFGRYYQDAIEPCDMEMILSLIRSRIQANLTNAEAKLKAVMREESADPIATHDAGDCPIPVSGKELS